MEDNDDFSLDLPRVFVSVVNKQSQRFIGAVMYYRECKSVTATLKDQAKSSTYNIEIFDFIDNAQFSNLDAFLVQIGSCILYLSDEFEDQSKGDGKKIHNVVSPKDIEIVIMKRSLFHKKADTFEKLSKLCSTVTHSLNVAEVERPYGYECIECLLHCLRLLDDQDIYGLVEVKLSSLATYMRLDSSAADSVNLLPKPDHPSQFGSIFGILNRCKTKMGTRVLGRWLRHPLLNVEEINGRLDIVDAFISLTSVRNELVDSTLKSIPDLDTLLSKFNKRAAGLGEVFKMYLFVRALPGVVRAVEEVVAFHQDAAKANSIRERYLVPCQALVAKLDMYSKLVEHVIDFSKLPDFYISANHDPSLKEIEDDLNQSSKDADKLLSLARNGWASFCDVKLEETPQNGWIFRSTKADDERELRSSNSSVRIISILKNGVHFTTKELERCSENKKVLEQRYKSLQTTLVEKIVETAMTYIPVFEAGANLVAEIDVLASFATASALSPTQYTRPTMLPQGQGIIDIKGGRHPCVELMEDVSYIPNDYCMHRTDKNFHIITGPNMGGKSTYIRGIGSILVMAQVGCFVPCDSATISVVDAVLARVGAGDAVQKGVSTFMAEMLEASVILQTATKDSLIIIDELGRGTSTFDGFGLAWSISQYIISNINCSCLFATHFHELTSLSKKFPSVSNKHVSAMVQDRALTMLYQIKEGPCLESFGIHVSQIAGFPSSVIDEAKRKASELESWEILTELDCETDAINNRSNRGDDSTETKRFKKTQNSLDAFSKLTEQSFNDKVSIKNTLSSII